MRATAENIVEMAVGPQDTVVELLQYQDDFVFSPAPYPAAVTAWGTGKTLAGIVKAIDLSQQNPGNLGIVFRKEFVDLRDSTVRDFQDYTGIKVSSARDVELGNGSTIMFRHLEEMNNIQNVNLGWFWIEQAEELDTDDQYFKLFGRLRRKGMPHCGYITANTKGHNWVWRLWKNGKFADAIRSLMDRQPELFAHLKDKNLRGLAPLFEASTFDNKKNLSPAFIAGLEIMREQKPRLYNRFVLNSWDDDDVTDLVVPPAWIDAAMARRDAADGTVVIGVDVARFGDDKTVLFPIRGHRALPYKVVHGNDTMQVCGHVMAMVRELHAGHVYVDTIGIGAGVFDRLKELGAPVHEVNVAKASTVIDPKTEKPRYRNLRSELWWLARESINTESELNDSPFSLPPDADLREQLASPRYTYNSAGQIEVESKDDMKERIGRSPDVADAYCLAVYGILGGDLKPAAYLQNTMGLVQRPSWL